METRLDALCTAANRLGDARRTVALAGTASRSCDVGDIRDDAADRCPPDRRAVRGVAFETLGRERQHDLFPTLGDRRATVRAFDGGSVVHRTDELVARLTVDEGAAHVAAALDARGEALA
jgi:hypothetical protein